MVYRYECYIAMKYRRQSKEIFLNSFFRQKHRKARFYNKSLCGSDIYEAPDGEEQRFSDPHWEIVKKTHTQTNTQTHTIADTCKILYRFLLTHKNIFFKAF